MTLKCDVTAKKIDFFAALEFVFTCNIVQQKQTNLVNAKWRLD